MSQPIRVVLVDDHRMFRSGVRSELAEEAADGIEIVGEAPDVETAVSVIKAEQPDVVLLDVHLPGGLGHGGGDVLRGCVAQESQRGEPIRFLALSVSDAAEDVIAVIRAGARGYVTKTINSTDLATAIRRVAEGDAVFSPRLAGFVLDAFGAAAGEIAEVDVQRLNAGGSLFLTRPSLAHHVADRGELLARAGEVLGAVADGSLEVAIGGRYPLTDAGAAYEALEGRATEGKLVLIP